jgi:hypothetical protein
MRAGDARRDGGTPAARESTHCANSGTEPEFNRGRSPLIFRAGSGSVPEFSR